MRTEYTITLDTVSKRAPPFRSVSLLGASGGLGEGCVWPFWFLRLRLFAIVPCKNSSHLLRNFRVRMYPEWAADAKASALLRLNPAAAWKDLPSALPKHAPKLAHPSGRNWMCRFCSELSGPTLPRGCNV